MEFSRHNIISKIHQSDQYFIVNLLSGNGDILTESEARKIFDGAVSNDPDFINKGYVVDREEEARSFRLKYLDFIDSREADEIQLFYVPTYACNFKCSYCYQSGYPDNNTGIPATETAAAFFDYVQKTFKGKRKYITLFGGEPLLPDQRSKRIVDYFVTRCLELDLQLAIVTNGYFLRDYIPVINHTSIREIQVTLDGPEKIHNIRRPLKDGQGTFVNISEGIDAAIHAGMPVNLRVVADRSNLESLYELARYAIEKGWTASHLFKTQIGRNYELHYCQSQQSNLYSRIELYRELYNQIRKHPEILEFHKPAFSVSRFLFENGELPDPLFDSCPGCKTEWAFDFTGRIYSCTATVGKPEEELGAFFPKISLNNEKISQWQQRDILSITKCAGCNLQLACGGGCASVAFNRERSLNAPDCRPVKELLELGIALYNEED